MPSKERIQTRADSKQRIRLTPQFQTKQKRFEIYYDQEKLLTVQIQPSKSVKDLDRMLKLKLKDRFYNYMGLESVDGFQVLDCALLNKNFSLSQICQNQKFRILLEGQVYDLHNPTLNDFLFLKRLGQGGSSIVYLVRHKQNCKMYALKQVNKTYISDFKKMEFLLREKKILTQIVNKSPCASKIYVTFQSKDHLNFLLKYYPGGQILCHLQDQKMNENGIKLYFCQVLLAIQNLHSQKIIYRDLKPENILIDIKGNAILSDFGLCKVNVKKEQLTVSYCGSDIYMPPEVKDHVGYNYHADFYTLGAFLYQMLTGLPPYYNCQSLDFPQTRSSEAIDLCLRLLESDLKKRLCDFKSIRQSKWLKNIEWQRVKNKDYQMPIKLNLYKSYIHEDFKEPLTFQEVNEPIFDRLFDFFFFMSDNEHGIGNCYTSKNSNIKQTTSQITKKTKCASVKKQKSKESQRIHQNSANKFQKMLEKQLQMGKNKQKKPKRQQKSGSSHNIKVAKSKSYKKHSVPTSPFVHQLNKDKCPKHSQPAAKTEKHAKQQQGQEKEVNIYQKNIRRPKKLQMKSVKSGSITGLSLKSLQVNTVLNSPIATKRKPI